jgi:hypothetical protein
MIADAAAVISFQSFRRVKSGLIALRCDLKSLSGRPALEGARPDASITKERCFGLYDP